MRGNNRLTGVTPKISDFYEWKRGQLHKDGKDGKGNRTQVCRCERIEREKLKVKDRIQRSHDYDVKKQGARMRRETRDGCSPGHSNLMRAGVEGKLGVEPLSVCNRARLPQICVCALLSTRARARRVLIRVSHRRHYVFNLQFAAPIRQP
jgi:hypothetical protein